MERYINGNLSIQFLSAKPTGSFKTGWMGKRSGYYTGFIQLLPCVDLLVSCNFANVHFGSKESKESLREGNGNETLES